jgi:hypothetical protein
VYQTRCAEIDGENGTTQAFNGVPAIEPLRFIWEVPGGGRLIPALKVRVILSSLTTANRLPFHQPSGNSDGWLAK